MAWRPSLFIIYINFYEKSSLFDIAITYHALPLFGLLRKYHDFCLFQSGTITNDGGFGTNGWRARDGDITDSARIPNHASWANPNLRVFGNQFQTATRMKETHTVINDFSTNLKWTPSDKWEFTADLQYIKATTDDDDAGKSNHRFMFDADIFGAPREDVKQSKREAGG